MEHDLLSYSSNVACDAMIPGKAPHNLSPLLDYTSINLVLQKKVANRLSYMTSPMLLNSLSVENHMSIRRALFYR
jgi:hypothetical protein